MELTLRDIMTSDVLALSADQTLNIAEDVMELANIRHLPVMDDGKFVGLVTHRDILRASLPIGLAGRPHSEEVKRAVRVDKIMRRNVRTVPPEMTAREGAALLLSLKYGCLPIVDATGALVGIVTEADFVRIAYHILKERAAPERQSRPPESSSERRIVPDDLERFREQNADLTEEQLYQRLAKELGVSLISYDEARSRLSESFFHEFSIRFLKAKRVIPLERRDQRIIAATSDPSVSVIELGDNLGAEELELYLMLPRGLSRLLAELETEHR